jgi:FtsZ-binding cell division protein ZapB
MESFESLSNLDLDDIESIVKVRDDILEFVEKATDILQILNNRIDEIKEKDIVLSEHTDKQSDYE